ncbi:glycosyltransferase [Erythrobacter sp. Alg231-14]|uniref:glycosyltransferase n=1 Tax=Erythrobacter sp. Alg231-14 TaxID=1922225 RepID=UPI000D55D3C5
MNSLSDEGSDIPTICIDCRYISDRPSGISQVIQGLIDHAPDLAPDLTFRLLKNARLKLPLSARSNVEEVIVQVGSNSPASMWFLPEIAPLLGADLYHATANTMPARLGMPCVTTVHDIMWLTNPEWCDSSPYGSIKRNFFGHGIRRAIAQSDRIATVSAATKAEIVQRYPASEPRICVTPSGVSDRFKPVGRDDRLKARLGLAQDAQYALIVGQFAPYKNHERAMQGFARSFGGERDKFLVMVQRQGGGTAPLERLAKSLGVTAQIRFTGPIDDADLINLYSDASMLLHPSLCEGFGNPVAEAMASGCPVVTSNRSAMPEVAGGAAVLVDPTCVDSIATAIAEVWNDNQKSHAMREAGIARAKEMRWIDFARANVAIYRSILAGL